MNRTVSETRVILLVAAAQFINILEFMMVMPLGPDFTRAIKIDSANLALIAGAYTGAAAISGLAGAFFLDRFDRRKALAWALFGLVCGTAAGALATDLTTLMVARAIAGLFGGPATSLAMAIVADTIPPERRGKAMGIVMGSFSIASVLGVPLALRLSTWFSWHAPFLAVAGMGLLVLFFAVAALPPMTGHLDAAKSQPQVRVTDFLFRPIVLSSYLTTAVVMLAGFMVIPSLAPYLQFNMGFPRERVELLYLVGGIASLVTMQISGRLVDRFGSTIVILIGVTIVIPILLFGFGQERYVVSQPVIYLLFVSFMVAMAFRNVAYNTLCSKVPSPLERARFMSIQSFVQHGSTALAAGISSALLKERADHGLIGMGRVTLLSVVLSLLIVPVAWNVERQVRLRLRATAS